jgi:hypothetical protein
MDIMAEAEEVQTEQAQTTAAHATNSMVSIRLSDVEIHPGVEDPVEEEVDPNETLSTRSPSIASKTSSSSSTGRDEVMSLESVDWEGLEKTEEQERCEDNTDKVGRYQDNEGPLLTDTGHCLTTGTARTSKCSPR